MRTQRFIPLFTEQSYTKYQNRVYANSPILYLPMDEGTGTVAIDHSGNGYDSEYDSTGIHTAGTSPFNRAAPYFDGTTTRWVDFYTAGFAGAFDMNEFTVLFWMKVNDATFWTDATARTLCVIYRDGTNSVQILRTATDNQLQFVRVDSGATRVVTVGSISETGWFCLAISFSLLGGTILGAGEIRAYIDGAQVGSTVTGGLTDAGSGLLDGVVLLGSGDKAGASMHKGYMAQLAIFDTSMTANILGLMTI